MLSSGETWTFDNSEGTSHTLYLHARVVEDGLFSGWSNTATLAAIGVVGTGGAASEYGLGFESSEMPAGRAGSSSRLELPEALC